MAHNRTEAEISAELHLWYEARTAAAAGKMFQMTTSAGTRMLSTQNLKEINNMIDMLERQLAGLNSTKQGSHNFALANLGDNGANP